LVAVRRPAAMWRRAVRRASVWASARWVLERWVSMQRASARRRSARVPAWATSGVRPASREAGAARQRQAPAVAQVAVARPALQPLPAQALSRAGSQESWRSVAALAVARRRNPRSPDRTGRPRYALLDSHLIHRSQPLPVADVPHLERSRSSESLRRPHRWSPGSRAR
jgi:hypothetical protein